MTEIPTPTAVDDDDESGVMYALSCVIAFVATVAAIGFSLGVLSVRMGIL